jgi:hypothetical protein
MDNIPDPNMRSKTFSNRKKKEQVVRTFKTRAKQTLPDNDPKYPKIFSICRIMKLAEICSKANLKGRSRKKRDQSIRRKKYSTL